MGSPEGSPKLPTEIPEWQLFQRGKVVEVDGKRRMIGFHDPEGNYHSLEEGEELVQIRREDGSGRDTFIRKNGEDIPFEIWKEGK